MDPMRIEEITQTGAARASDPLLSLAEAIRSRRATVAVVGLGYVGLPLLTCVRNAGFTAIGMDSDPERVEQLLAGRSYIVDVTDSDLSSMGPVTFSTDAALLEQAQVIIICVPTPLTDHTPDLSAVRAAAEEIGRRLRPGRLVVLESTTYPGTTEEVVRPALEVHSGLTAGVDFALAYSPERIDPGQTAHRVESTPKVVAGLTEGCRDLVTSFYSSFVRDIVTTSSPRDAEMAKLIENTFRQVNIALVNELAVMANQLDVDIWEALSAASTKPFGYMPFWPGPGVGGHCISVDPSYLSWKAGQQRGYRISFIEHANEVNNRMPDYVAARVGEALNDAGKPIRGSRILAVGVAYKPGVNDLRESPALAVVERLAAKGAEVSYSDPYVAELQVNGYSLKSEALEEALLAEQDCVVLLTIHPELDLRRILNGSPLIFDARGATAGMDAPNVIRL